MEDALLQRYSRHIMLDEFGIDGQRRLSAAAILVVGAGGLGCPAALYLAAAGAGSIILFDDDLVDLTNLQRQILHTTSRIGKAKTTSAKKALTDINPHCEVLSYRRRLTAKNITAAIARCDIVLDCSDNYATRHVVNRACVRAKKPLVFAAASSFDAQLAVFDTRNNESPCYNCLFSEDDTAEETPCALMGVYAPLVGMAGCLQAAEAIKLAAMPDLVTPGKLFLIDAKKPSFREIIVPRDPACKVCLNERG